MQVPPACQGGANAVAHALSKFQALPPIVTLAEVRSETRRDPYGERRRLAVPRGTAAAGCASAAMCHHYRQPWGGTEWSGGSRTRHVIANPPACGFAMHVRSHPVVGSRGGRGIPSHEGGAVSRSECARPRRQRNGWGSQTFRERRRGLLIPAPSPVGVAHETIMGFRPIHDLPSSFSWTWPTHSAWHA